MKGKIIMQKIRKMTIYFINFIMNNIRQIIATITIVFLLSTSVFASGNIGSSKLATGTEQLIKDLTAWLLVIAPTLGGLTIIYFFIRRTIGDEMDHKKWNGRIAGAFICTILATLASGLITMLMDYFR